MATGLALTIGLNSVDPKHYGGWSGDLMACEADAHDMADIAMTQGFEATTLLTKDATRERVTDAIRDAAKKLQPGDIFMLSYSGHGGQVPDRNSDEKDMIDETWCLYDGQLIDDENNALFSEFAQGVRILVFSDSCHSGSVTKAAYYHKEMNMRATNVDIHQTRFRFMPTDMAYRTYHLNREFYDQILKRQDLRESENRVKASTILISGCQDNQLSADGTFNGLFTSQLLAVWQEGAFDGSYRQFRREIVKRMPPDQTPQFYLTGQYNPNFVKQKPFTI